MKKPGFKLTISSLDGPRSTTEPQLVPTMSRNLKIMSYFEFNISLKYAAPQARPFYALYQHLPNPTYPKRPLHNYTAPEARSFVLNIYTNLKRPKQRRKT